MQIYQPPSQRLWRKKKIRLVSSTPPHTIYQPLNNIESIELIIITHDELEALKIKNINKKGIIQGAMEMWISKSTFANLYNSAVCKFTEALIYGKTIYIETAQNYGFSEPII